MPAPLTPPPTTSTSTSCGTAVERRSAAGLGIATILASLRRGDPADAVRTETSARPRSGHVELARDRVRRERRHRRPRAARVPPDLPGAGLGRARPEGDLDTRSSRPRARRSRRRRLDAGDIAGIGITNQRETTIVWNRCHRRADRQRDRLAGPAHRGGVRGLAPRGLEPLFRERTGLVLDAYFSGTKLAWLLDHVAGARAAAERGELAFGTVDSWLMWLLTGGSAAATRAGAVHATDVSERVANAPLRRAARRLGRRAADGAERAALGAARGPSVEPSLRAHGGRAVRRADRDRRRRRRSAERAVRPGVLSLRARPRTPTAPAASC